MSQPFVGEIRMFGGNFAPAGWLFCRGQLLLISENETLFALIGTIYGGDGQQTFGIPDLSGRIPVHVGTGFTLGQLGGVESVTLTTQQIPSHAHQMRCDSNMGSSVLPANNAIAGSALSDYVSSAADQPMNSSMIQNAGGNQPHDNMMPYLCISFIISLFGIFPSQT